MEMETGKLFIGGISWDTSEERLREYFEAFGEVVEAVIMKDRTTGRARGFGFVVFADASVADKVVRERHVIDGRTVEAKKAVPREDHQNMNRNNGSAQGSPVPTRTKKIFVGGLASTVTESEFKRYFDQFGTITDVVVMYDHNTQRPRGFGFITFDSEEAVDKVLTKTFHELNGKMVEVKRAVPKELSPGPTRSPSASGYSYGGLNRMSNLLNAYSHPGFTNSSSMGGYGVRMGGPFSLVGRSGYPPYSPSSYNMGLNLNSGFGLNFGGPNGDSGLGYGRGLGSYYSGNTNRYSSAVGYDVGNGENGPLLNAANRNMLGNSSLNSYNNTNSVSSNAFPGSAATGNRVIGNNYGNIGEIWGSSAQGGGSGSFSNANIGYGNSGDSNFGGGASYGRNIAGAKSSYFVGNDVGDGAFRNLYGDESIYGNHAWRSSSPGLEGPVSFGYGRGATADVAHNSSIG